MIDWVAIKKELEATQISGVQYVKNGRPDTGHWGAAYRLMKDSPAPPTGQSLASFGVKGDGSDERVALQTALNSGDVYGEQGKTYRSSSLLQLAHGVDFKGAVVQAGFTTTSPNAGLWNATVRNPGGTGVKVNQDTALSCDGLLVELSDTGLYVAVGAKPCNLNGRAERNVIGLEIHSANGGSVPNFVANDNAKFGVIFYDMAGWHFGTLEASNQGNAASNQAGTGVELWQNCHDNIFDKIIALKNPGYALALNHASNNNLFKEIFADASGAMDSDPGVSFVDGSSFNRIKKLTVKHHTVGVRFGENDSGTDQPVNDNIVEVFVGSGLAYGAVRFEHGDRNRVDAAALSDIGAVWQPWVRAALEFAPLTYAAHNNKVGSVVRSGGWPSYGTHFGTNATGNSSPASAGAVLDESGGKNTTL